jgi:hypothetical protein
MASFAQLDENNKIINVIKISNDETIDNEGNEVEDLGIQRCRQIVGDENSKWIQTFFGDTETTRKGNPARINGYYDESLDAFLPEKFYQSWVVDEENLSWKAPVPMPTNASESQFYRWNENIVNWELYPPVPMPSESPEGFYYEWIEDNQSWELIEIHQPITD